MKQNRLYTLLQSHRKIGITLFWVIAIFFGCFCFSLSLVYMIQNQHFLCSVICHRIHITFVTFSLFYPFLYRICKIQLLVFVQKAEQGPARKTRQVLTLQKHYYLFRNILISLWAISILLCPS